MYQKLPLFAFIFLTPFVVILLVILAYTEGRKENPGLALKAEDSTGQRSAFMLASLEFETVHPSDDQVLLFQGILDSLVRKCTETSELEIANIVYKTKSMIDDRGGVISYADAGLAIDGSIPDEAAGVMSCADIAAALVTLMFPK